MTTTFDESKNEEEMHAHNKDTNNKYEMIKDESRQPECSANTRAQSE